MLYWDVCHRTLEQLEHAEAEAHELGGLPRGRLRLSAPYDFGAAEIEPAILDFVAAFPDDSDAPIARTDEGSGPR